MYWSFIGPWSGGEQRHDRARREMEDSWRHFQRACSQIWSSGLTVPRLSDRRELGGEGL